MYCLQCDMHMRRYEICGLFTRSVTRCAIWAVLIPDIFQMKSFGTDFRIFNSCVCVCVWEEVFRHYSSSQGGRSVNS